VLVCLHYLPADCFQARKYPLIATCNQTVISRGKNYDDTHGVTQITQHFRFGFFVSLLGLWTPDWCDKSAGTLML